MHEVKVDVGAPLEDVVTLVDPEVGSSVSANVIVDVGAVVESLNEPFNVGALVDDTSDVGSFVEVFCVGLDVGAGVGLDVGLDVG